MAGFAIEDSLIKLATRSIPIGEVLILFGLGGMLIYSGILRFKGESVFHPDVLSRPMIIRFGFEITGRLFYTLAIALIPLSVATVILQATPLVVVACAVVVFGEKVGWRRWAAIFIGLVGVIVIVQPGAGGFSNLTVLAIVGMLGFAGRDLASRIAPRTISTAHLGVYGFLAIVVAGIVYSIWANTPLVMPDGKTALFVIGATVFGVFGYSCLMKAMKTGEVSAVTPFRYTRLLFGVALGLLLFGESLTPAMVFGSILIVVSGLFIVWRGKRV